jgi:hypothetical protein
MTETLEDKVKDFKKLVKDGQKMANTLKQVYDNSDLEESEKARARVTKHAMDTNGVPPDFNDRAQILAIIKDLTNRYEAAAEGYFEQNDDYLLNFEKIRKNLAENAAGIPSAYTGEAGHDRLVDLHKNVEKYQGLIHAYQEKKIPYGKVAKEIAEELEADLERRRSKDKLGKYITSEYAKERDAKFRKNVIRAILSNEGTGTAALSMLANDAAKALYEAIGDEEARAKYAKKNIKQLFYHGDTKQVSKLEQDIEDAEDEDKADREDDLNDYRLANRATAVDITYKMAA